MPPSSDYYAEKIRENALELVVCDLVREKEATWGWLPISPAIRGLASAGVVISRTALKHRIKRKHLQRRLHMSPSHYGRPPPQSVQFEKGSISSLSSISDQSPRALHALESA